MNSAQNPPPISLLTKLGLFFAAISVVLLAMAIFWRAAAFPHIGIQSTFALTVLRTEPKLFLSPKETWPEVGDKILTWNNQPLTSWPSWLDRLESPSLLETAEPLRLKFQRAQTGEIQEVLLRPSPASFVSLVPSALWLLLKLALFALGLVLYWRQSESRFSHVFFWMTLVSVGAYMGGYHWTQIANSPALLSWFVVSASLLMPVSLHFFLRFPRTHPLMENHPWLIKAAMYGPAAGFLGIFFFHWFVIRWLEGMGVDKPELAVAFQKSLATMLWWIYAYIAVSSVLYVSGWLVLADSLRRTTDPTEKSQIRWILAGLSAALIPIGYTLWLSFSPRARLGSGENTWPMLAASSIVTVAFAISLTRYRLQMLERYVGGGMNILLVSGFAGFFYYALIFFGMVFVGLQVAEVPSAGQILAVATTALVLVILLDLTRGRILAVVISRFRQQRRQLDETLHEMHQVVDRLVDPNTLARALLRHATQVVEVKRGAIYLIDPQGMALVVHQGGEAPPAQVSDEAGLWDRLARVPFISLESTGSASATPQLALWKRHLASMGMGAAVGLRHEGKLRGILYLGTRPDHGFPEDLRHLVLALAQITALARVNGEEHRHIESLGRELQTKVDQIARQQQHIHSLQAQLTRARPEPPEPSLEVAPASAEVSTAGSRSKLLGTSPACLDLLDMARKVAPSSSAVLLRGESGTGKEVLAEWIHERSPRGGKPLVKVHCAALAAGLLESELFGHVRGAFTNAHRDKPGRFEMADGGTLFLDEIGDISPEVQTKLLRVLQERTFERVGSNESLTVDVRIIAATHRNLEELMEKGAFRRDLFYRLNVFPIYLPPLRERQIDIPELATDLLQRAASKAGIAPPPIDDEALALLKSHNWPGNIRELQNHLERAMMLAEGGIILPRHLGFDTGPNSDMPEDPYLALFTPDFQSASSRPQRVRANESKPGLSSQKRHEWQEREKERITRAIALAAGNKSVAARNLGIPRSTLVSRMRKLGLE